MQLKTLFFILWALLLHGTVQAGDTLSILFTHDLHSAFIGSREADSNGHITRTGGYARLYTAIDQIRRKNPEATLLVDGGDVVMGTFFHTLFTTHCAELHLMNKMGYEATTLGNHDFDFGVDALQKALRIYTSAPLKTCTVLALNIQGIGETQEYKVIEKAGCRIGVFGLLGTEAHTQSLIDKDLPYENYITAAQRMVKFLRETEKVDIVVCLSHAGTHKDVKRSEDEQLARRVPDIDVIVSGHSHTVLPEPIRVGNTVIASAGAYGKYLGYIKLALTNGTPQLAAYELLKIDSTFAENEVIKTEIERYKKLVEENYLQAQKIDFDAPVAKVMHSVFARPDSIALGSLLADAFIDAVQKAENKHPDIAVVPVGTIRENLYEGHVTAEEVFNILSLGIGSDGKPAFPLLKVYLYGHELRDLCEVDASIAGAMSDAQLFFSGIRYTYYPHSLFCNKVKKVEIRDSAEHYAVPESDRLYSVVAGLYTAKMIGVVKSETYGLLSLLPKNAEGKPLTNWDDAIVRDAAGNEIKEWHALKNYLEPAAKTTGGSSEFSYNTLLREQKIEQPHFSLIEEINYLTIFALCVYITTILLFITILFFIIKLVRKSRR